MNIGGQSYGLSSCNFASGTAACAKILVHSQQRNAQRDKPCQFLFILTTMQCSCDLRVIKMFTVLLVSLNISSP